MGTSIFSIVQGTGIVLTPNVIDNNVTIATSVDITAVNTATQTALNTKADKAVTVTDLTLSSP